MNPRPTPPTPRAGALALCFVIAAGCGASTELRDQPHDGDGDAAVSTHTCGTIAPGEAHSGALTMRSARATVDGRDRVAFVERLCLEAGETVTVLMCSPAASRFDTYVILARDGREVARDDDSAGGLQSRLVFTASEAATYDLVLSTFNTNPPAAPGTYLVNVLAGEHRTEACP